MSNDQTASSPQDDELDIRVNDQEARQPAEKRKKLLPQLSLFTLLLSIALIAVWLAWWQAGQSIANLERQMPGLQSVARELRIDDPTQFAAVEKMPYWHDENICEIYVPADQSYRLCLAMDAIDKDGLSDPLGAVSLPSGEHRIEIRYDSGGSKSTVRILVDKETVLEESRSKDWEAHRGSSGGIPFSQSKQYPTDEPLVLFRRRFYIRLPSNKFAIPTPSPGILVWVESGTAE